jgi:hypothetical protein
MRSRISCRALALLASLTPVLTAQSMVAGRTSAEWRQDLQHPQPLVRLAAVDALLRFEAGDAATVRELTMLVRDPARDVRRSALRGLGLAGSSARSAIATIETAWHTDDDEVARDAAHALLAIEPARVQRFVGALRSASPAQRVRGADALAGAMPRTRVAIHALRDALRDEAADVRGAALRALSVLDPSPGRTTAHRLRDALVAEVRAPELLTDAASVQRAADALVLLKRGGTHAGHARAVLAALLHDAPPALRTQAAQCLAVNDDGVRVLDRALVTGDAATRGAVAAGLAHRGLGRVTLRATTDSLRAPGFVTRDTARAREILSVVGRVASPTRQLRRTLDALRRDSVARPLVDATRTRLARDP